MVNDTRILLNLTDPHLTFSSHWLKFILINKIKVAQILCTLSYTPKACPNCGIINHGQIVKYRFYKAKHKYGQFRTQPLMLVVKTQRFRCPDCQTTFNCILQGEIAEKCNDFLHSLAAHFLFYLVI